MLFGLLFCNKICYFKIKALPLYCENQPLNPTTMKTLEAKIEKMEEAVAAAIEAKNLKNSLFQAITSRVETIDLGEPGVCEYTVHDGLDEYLEAAALEKKAYRKARRTVESVASEFGLIIKDDYLSHLHRLQQAACRLILRFEEVAEIARRVDSFDSCFSLAE